MSWSYDSSVLTTTTAAGRLNTVRLLVGDTDIEEPLVQNEEITFALAQTSDSVYSAASYISGIIAAKYSRLVDTQLDGVLEEKYSDLAKNFRSLQKELKSMGQRVTGASLGVSAGGIKTSVVDTVEDDSERVAPAFTMNQFDFEGDGDDPNSYD